MGGEIAGTEIGGGEGQDFEGEAFGFDHYEARDREADHGKPIVEGWVDVRKNVRWDGLFEKGSHLFLSGRASSYAPLRNGRIG